MPRHVLSLCIVLACAARLAAQYAEPILLFNEDEGRPAAGYVEGAASGASGGDDLYLEPVVVMPKLWGPYALGFTIVEVPGGDPILVYPTLWVTGGGSGQGGTGNLVNDDPSDDFVTAGEGGTFTVAPGLPGPAVGTPATWSLPGTQKLERVAVLDVDGTGADDLALGDASGVHLVVNAGAAGWVPLTPGVPTVPLANLRDIAVGDVDGDGHDDLVLCAGAGAAGSVQVWRRSVAASGPPFTLTGTLDPGMAVAAAEVMDLDGDGLDDLVVSLHELTAGAPYRGWLKAWLSVGGTFGGAPYASWLRTSATGTLPTFGAQGDVDGDGDLDAVWTATDSIAYPPGTFAQFNPPLALAWMENRIGTGGGLSFWVGATRYVGKANDPLLVDFPQATGLQGGPGDAPAGPADPGTAPGDGALDLALSWSSDQAAGGLPPDEEETQTFVAALFSHDGWPRDAGWLNTKTQVRPGDGDVGPIDVFGSTAKTLDLLIPNRDSNSLTVVLNDGTGHAAMVQHIGSISTLGPAGWSGGPSDARLADLDEDGRLDAAVYGDYASGTGAAGTLSLLLGDGWGEFAKVQELALAFGGEQAVGDLDGDGHVDALVTRRRGPGAPQDLEIHFGDGTGQVDTASAPLAVAAGAGVRLCGGLAIGDPDLDGDLDAASTWFRAKLSLPPAGGGDAPTPVGTGRAGVVLFQSALPGGGGVTPRLSTFESTGSAPDIESVALAQHGGSAWPDVSAGFRDGRLWHALGDGSGLFTLQAIDPESAGAGGGSIVLADIDLDGRADVVSHRGWPAQQAVVQVLLEGWGNDLQVAEIGGWCPADVDGGTRPLVGDFDADGWPDLAVVHPDDSVTVLLNVASGLGAGAPAGPTLLAQPLPAAGGPLVVQVSGLPPLAPGLLLLGWPPQPAAAPLGSWAFVADADGRAALRLPLPEDPPPVLALQALVRGPAGPQASSVLVLELEGD